MDPAAAPMINKPPASHGRTGSFAPASPPTSTLALASAFMNTMLQSPERGVHSTVGSPVPCVDVAQIDSPDGGPDGAPPSCVLLALTSKL